VEGRTAGLMVLGGRVDTCFPAVGLVFRVYIALSMSSHERCDPLSAYRVRFDTRAHNAYSIVG